MGANAKLKSIFLFLILAVITSCLYTLSIPENEPQSEPPGMVFGVPPPFAQDQNAANPAVITNKEPDSEKVKKGEALFKMWCRGCHEIQSKTSRVGPGLKDLFKQENLPMSLKRVTPQNIRVQIRTPFRYMPPLPNLSEAEIEQIIEFLKTI